MLHDIISGKDNIVCEKKKNRLFLDSNGKRREKKGGGLRF